MRNLLLVMLLGMSSVVCAEDTYDYLKRKQSEREYEQLQKTVKTLQLRNDEIDMGLEPSGYQY